MKNVFISIFLIVLTSLVYSQQEKKLTLEEQYRFAVRDLYGICTGINSFYVTEGKFPEKLEDCVPFHLDKDTLKDPWGKPYLFKACIVDGKELVLAASGGSDGVFIGWEQKGQYLFKDCKGKDIIFNPETRLNLPFGPKFDN